MPTLQEMLEEDFGLGSEKVAGAHAAEGTDPTVDQLAAELGLFGDETEKVASESNIDDLYNQLNSDGETEKFASEEEKVAAAREEALGARAYDYFAAGFDKRIEKIAEAVMSAPKAKMTDGNPHGDSRAEQQQPSNYAGNGGKAIDTTPVVTDEVSKGDDVRVEGHYEQKKASVMNAAIRKHLLLAELQG